MATEEPTVAIDSAPEPAEDKPAETKASRKSGRVKKAKEPKAKKAAAPKKPRAPPSHPPYEEVFYHLKSCCFFFLFCLVWPFWYVKSDYVLISDWFITDDHRCNRYFEREDRFKPVRYY